MQILGSLVYVILLYISFVLNFRQYKQHIVSKKTITQRVDAIKKLIKPQKTQ